MTATSKNNNDNDNVQKRTDKKQLSNYIERIIQYCTIIWKTNLPLHYPQAYNSRAKILGYTNFRASSNETKIERDGKLKAVHETSNHYTVYNENDNMHSYIYTYITWKENIKNDILFFYFILLYALVA